MVWDDHICGNFAVINFVSHDERLCLLFVGVGVCFLGWLFRSAQTMNFWLGIQALKVATHNAFALARHACPDDGINSFYGSTRG